MIEYDGTWHVISVTAMPRNTVDVVFGAGKNTDTAHAVMNVPESTQPAVGSAIKIHMEWEKA